MHPCRKLVLNEVDQDILNFLKEEGVLRRPWVSLDDLHAFLLTNYFVDKVKLMKRLKALHKHKYIFYKEKSGLVSLRNL